MGSLETSDPYFKALGIFVHAFAEVEGWMLTMLTMLSGVRDESGPALFSGVRIEQGISFIRRLYEAHRCPIDPALDEALRQLAIINNVRNRILHYGGLVGGDARVVSTYRAAHIPERIQEFPISATKLDAMSEDLLTIIYLFSVVLPRSRPWIIPDSVPAFEPPAWQHKPQSPTPDPDRSRDQTPKREPPPC
jgi:hypothetical protein